jgi:hypothetical protein
MWRTLTRPVAVPGTPTINTERELSPTITFNLRHKNNIRYKPHSWQWPYWMLRRVAF